MKGIRSNYTPKTGKVINDNSLDFVMKLHERFADRINELMLDRQMRDTRLMSGEKLGFLPETNWIRESEWKVSEPPKEISCRKTEITGPVDAKTIINALNSGADCFMADFEDSCAPTWENLCNGQDNLFDANRGTLEFSTGVKEYKLNDELATLIVRPRGLHMMEKHITHNGLACNASLVDFGFYAYSNLNHLHGESKGMFLYLPKLESHQEATLWNDVFTYTENELGVPSGTIRATVLIETITAAFEMDEILHELKDHSIGLNCGRWDYIFSYIKKIGFDRRYLLPGRSKVTMDSPFMDSYVKLLTETCHKRGTFAMGGMAAQVPIRGDDEANQNAISKVMNDKEREARIGMDGTWVAHPGLILHARSVFDHYFKEDNQIKNLVTYEIDADDLLQPLIGTVSKYDINNNISVSLEYLTNWLEGNGCVAINNLMEDMATVEIARAQLWQWKTHEVKDEDGDIISGHRLLKKITEIGDNAKYSKKAVQLLGDLVLNELFDEFITNRAYLEID